MNLNGPHRPGIVGPKRRKIPEKPADLDYEAWRRDMVYQIYGPQEESAKAKRERAGEGIASER